MKGLPFVLLFTAMTFISWGAYGPTLHHGATALHHDSLRAFVGVGLAYFLIAVIIPFVVLKRSGEVGRWTITGTIYSLVAGAVGAVGALGILLALGYGGLPIYVMPLVFGFAPIVNTLVTAFLSRTFDQIRPIFVIGVIAAALGAVGVLTFKPTASKAASPLVATQVPGAESSAATSLSKVDASPARKIEAASSQAADADKAESDAADTEKAHTEKADTEKADAVLADNETGDEVKPPQPGTVAAANSSAPVVQKKPVQWWGVMVSIIVAAACWGSYGPVLHIGQGKMAGSRLRPFACVGLAYFLIAVAAPLVLIYSRSVDLGSWTALGMGWSFVAGVAGAVGALGVILAFNAGGKPYYVMPLIFGFAPVINTFISVSEAGTWGRVPLLFWASLAVVIAGAVTVLTNAPRPKPHK